MIIKRIGNDVTGSWKIQLSSGILEEFDPFVDMFLEVRHAATGHSQRIPFVIEGGDTINYSFLASEQMFTGVYDIVTSYTKLAPEIRGRIKTYTHDKCGVFQLISKSCSLPDSDKPIDIITLIEKGDPGLSAYQIAVFNGFEGTEEEWLQSIRQPALDAATLANEKGAYAEQQGNFANEQAIFANEQGNLAATKTGEASIAITHANDAASSAEQQAGYAFQQAQEAQTAANNANEKASLASQKAQLADEKASLASQKAQLADKKAQLADDMAQLANNAASSANNATDALLSNIISFEIREDLCLYFKTPDPYNGVQFEINKGNLIAKT